jgi:hypothetical protein
MDGVQAAVSWALQLEANIKAAVMNGMGLKHL